MGYYGPSIFSEEYIECSQRILSIIAHDPLLNSDTQRKRTAEDTFPIITLPPNILSLYIIIVGIILLMTLKILSLEEEVQEIIRHYDNLFLQSSYLSETNTNFSHAKDVDQILCLSFTLIPKDVAICCDLIIIKYHRLLNDKQIIRNKWYENWAKWSVLSTDEDKAVFDCAQQVTKNLANSESENSKARLTSDGNNHGRKPGFRVN
ncbi:hypothetical protein GLOIN_2v1885930 [Rhizophagus clarus]|uniref:Uncharacterized protein n=1 Tax=Rhizophagus clarus TaxID=94130 RepID=A0A8H3M835_9GLOM|nr:hypothetical protein GLOIN_2v1885930 [Rhizophagus clarus]